VTRSGDKLLRPVRDGALAQAMAPAARAAAGVHAERGEDRGGMSAAVVAFERFGSRAPAGVPS
jgi:hypothetical protein